MPKKSIIMIAVTAAVLALVFTIPVFATGCDDDTAAYNNRVAGQMMDRDGNSDGRGNGTVCQGRANNADRGADCTGDCTGDCDGNGGGANCTGDCDGTCDGADCTGGSANCTGDCDDATTSDEVLCF